MFCFRRVWRFTLRYGNAGEGWLLLDTWGVDVGMYTTRHLRSCAHDSPPSTNISTDVDTALLAQALGRCLGRTDLAILSSSANYSPLAGSKMMCNPRTILLWSQRYSEPDGLVTWVCAQWHHVDSAARGSLEFRHIRSFLTPSLQPPPCA